MWQLHVTRLRHGGSIVREDEMQWIVGIALVLLTTPAWAPTLNFELPSDQVTAANQCKTDYATITGRTTPENQEIIGSGLEWYCKQLRGQVRKRTLSSDINADVDAVGELGCACGDNVLCRTEECDGTADSACPGVCTGSCTCPTTTTVPPTTTTTIP